MNLVLFTGLSCMHFGVFTKHVWVAGSTEPESVWLSLRQKITLGSLVILVCDSDFHFIWCKRNKYWRSTRKAFKNKEAKPKESTLSGSSWGNAGVLHRDRAVTELPWGAELGQPRPWATRGDFTITFAFIGGPASMIPRGSFQPEGYQDSMKANANIAANFLCSFIFEFSSTK